jgi:twitching motility protein PilU
MRQAPDCILIGEIRDKETMQAAIAYAQTGHLCLGTLHANNSYHALNRIISFFPMENRQRCSLTSRSACAPSFRSAWSSATRRQAVPACEVMLNTRHVSELIERGEVQALKDAMEQTLAPGSQTFEQDLFRLYREGVITLDEALTNADSPTNLSWLINNNELVPTHPRREEKASETPYEFDYRPGGPPTRSSRSASTTDEP